MLNSRLAHSLRQEHGLVLVLVEGVTCAARQGDLDQVEELARQLRQCLEAGLLTPACVWLEHLERASSDQVAAMDPDLLKKIYYELALYPDGDAYRRRMLRCLRGNGWKYSRLETVLRQSRQWMDKLISYRAKP